MRSLNLNKKIERTTHSFPPHIYIQFKNIFSHLTKNDLKECM